MNSQEYNEEKAAKKVERAEAKTAKASRAVFAHSEELRSLDDETPRSEQKKVFTREAKRLVNNKTVIVPRTMIENGIRY
jgi:hypothetical protein